MRGWKSSGCIEADGAAAQENSFGKSKMVKRKVEAH
jgi:hypothetical protein